MNLQKIVFILCMVECFNHEPLFTIESNGKERLVLSVTNEGVVGFRKKPNNFEDIKETTAQLDNNAILINGWYLCKARNVNRLEACSSRSSNSAFAQIFENKYRRKFIKFNSSGLLNIGSYNHNTTMIDAVLDEAMPPTDSSQGINIVPFNKSEILLKSTRA